MATCVSPGVPDWLTGVGAGQQAGAGIIGQFSLDISHLSFLSKRDPCRK